ncbi:hypothetical protein EUC41_08395 [Achromobacter denitrificans]|uniref:hypothetical protein n=1 Tax=Achromobacter denitrificans TaxID=32002 RepID=UPI00240D6D12|nr:hypothetical protein [Achromobacter denitrificans]WFC66337.1 hypothetical protein EUC41_08395 [Achromobacter denitrificans]
MKAWFVRLIGETVAEVIPGEVEINGEAVHISSRYHSDFISSLISVHSAPHVGDEYRNGEFSKPSPKPVDLAAIRASRVALVQAYLDAAARSLNYDSIANAISYADEPTVPKFQVEGRALRAWRSLVWARFYEILAEAETGSGDMPVEAALIANLPVFNSPDVD